MTVVQQLEKTKADLDAAKLALVKSEEETTEAKAESEDLKTQVAAIRTELDEVKGAVAAIQKAMEPEEKPEGEEDEEPADTKAEDMPEDKPEETKALLSLVLNLNAALDAKDVSAKAKASAELITLCASMGIAPPLKTGAVATTTAPAVPAPNLTGLAKTIAALKSKSTK